MPTPGPRSRRRWLLAGSATLIVVVAAAVVVLLLHSPGNVSHPSVSFTQPPTTATTTPPPVKHAKPVDNFLWAFYGYNAARDRDYGGTARLHPPFRVGWRFGGNALIEFPPVVYGHTLFFMDDGATAKAVDTLNGHQRWATHLGQLSAASPAIGLHGHMIYVPVLSDDSNTPGNGRIAALSMRTGHVVWSRALPSGSESSPVISGHTLYFGDQSGTVYSLNALNGHVNWTYHASGAVKAGPALSDGILYFGDYAGRAYALNAGNGHQVWAVTTSGTSFGFGSGNFYSTPAVAFGRVYMGNTDGRVYSFAARTGQLAWATSTGAYVYASPAVAAVPGLGPTVYLGSYNGEFYAFNAQSGAVRWSHAAGGRISGAATVVGNVVYYSDLGSKTSTGLDVRTGRVVFSFSDGAFTPVIADPGEIYVSGYDTIYQLLPKSSARAGPRAITRRAGATTVRARSQRVRSRRTRRSQARGKRHRRK
jgi:outer membrane protein assembly factor BamB